MRLNLYLRGIDLVDVEIHGGSRGLYLDVSVFKPRQEDPPAPKAVETTSDLTGTVAGDFERDARGPVWHQDQPAVVQTGFQPSRERAALHQAFRALAFQYGGTSRDAYTEPEDLVAHDAMLAVGRVLGKAGC